MTAYINVTPYIYILECDMCGDNESYGDLDSMIRALFEDDWRVEWETEGPLMQRMNNTYTCQSCTEHAQDEEADT